MKKDSAAVAERRGATRVAGPLDGFTAGHRPIRISDLSVTGCFVETMEAVASGDAIDLQIQIPNWGLLPLQGQVAYTSAPFGFAVHFMNVRADTQIVLQAAVEALAGRRL
ncbi:MAG: PilZ domain-containing protein [Vicinamibacterales bacterium]